MIDQATTDLIAAMAAAGRRPLHESTPEEARAAGAGSAAMFGPGPEMHATQDRTLTSADGAEFAVRVLTPVPEPQGILVYLHGGGWVVGDIEGFDTLGRKIAARTESTVVLVNYRKAPEAPFPLPVDDASEAVRWADEVRHELARTGAPLIVGGDSAGGNLTVAAVNRARANGIAVDSTVLVYPVTDSDMSTPSYVDPANQLLLSREGMQWFFSHYLGDQDATHPEVSPLRLEDLAGFPPSIVLIAEHDPLRSEGEAFAARLDAVGSLVASRLYEGQMHGFFSMVNILPASEEAIAFVSDFITDRVGARVGGSE